MSYRDVTTVGFQVDPVLNCEAFAVRAQLDWEIRNEIRFIASNRAVANLFSEGRIPLDWL